MSTARSTGALTLIVAALAAGVAVAQPPSSIKIPFETYTLPNGLTVITSNDPTTPTVAVNL